MSQKSDYFAHEYPIPAPIDQPGLEVTQQQYRAQEQGDYLYTRVNDTNDKRYQNPWGLSPIVFGSLLVILTAIVVGGAVGGGLGASCKSIGSSKACSSSNTSATITANMAPIAVSTPGSATPTIASFDPSNTNNPPAPSSIANYEIFDPQYVGNLSNPCFSMADTVPGPNGDSFSKLCGNDQNSGDPNNVLINIVGVIAYSIEDCIWACSNYNAQYDFWQRQDTTTGKCRAVTWQQDLASAYTNYQANCWLKNGSAAGTTDNNAASFVLQ